MARIYYKEERNLGKTIETKVINIDNFIKIINTSEKLSHKIEKIFSFKRYFKYYQIQNDGIKYKDRKNGDFYLPKSIIFYDIPDFTFPSEFYFVALIGNRLELMKADGGNNVKWYEMTGRYSSVDDEKVVKKIENSMIEILDEIKNYKEPEKEQKRQRIKGIELNREIMKDFLFKLNIEKHFSNDIVEMALSPTDFFDKNQDLLEKYKIYSASKNMYLLYLVGLLEERNIVITMDWKTGFDDVVWGLRKIADIPSKIADAECREKTVGGMLGIISKQLEKETDKTIFCIDTDSDSYSFGMIEKSLFEELASIGKQVDIKVYRPEE